MQLIVLVVLLVATWAFVILPQQRRVKAHRAFVDSLQVGDEVVTTAGVYGTITELSDDRARLCIAPGVEITIARLAIGRPQDEAAPGQPTAADAEQPASDTPTDHVSE